MNTKKIPVIDGPHKDFADRFRKAVNWAGLLVYDAATGEKVKGSYDAIGKQLGFTRQYARGLYCGQSFPSGKKGGEIAKRLKVDYAWLITGEGSMVKEQVIDISHLSEEQQNAARIMISSIG